MALLVAYSTKAEIRLAASAILIVWLLAVIMTGIRYNRKHPGPAGRTLAQRLASSTWLVSFLYLAFLSVILKFIFSFDAANRLQVAGLVFMFATLLVLISITHGLRKIAASGKLSPSVEKYLENRQKK
jgi:uncharacterized membrane protein YqjE